MFKRILPFVLIAVVVSLVFSVLFATQRLGHPHPALARFMRRRTDLPVEPVEPEPETDA